MTIERRFVASDLEVRTTGDTASITGYAAVFNKDSEVLGFFIEQVRAGAFKKTITEADIRALQNHDPNLVLGRNRSGTLKLAEDTKGLHYEALGNLRKQSVRDLVEDIERGDVTQSSFGFSTVKDEWDYDSEPMRRALQEVRLFDVSPVTFPAYTDTEAQIERALRSLVRGDDHMKQLVVARQFTELRSYLISNTAGTPEPVVESEEPAVATPEERTDNHSTVPMGVRIWMQEQEEKNQLGAA